MAATTEYEFFVISIIADRAIEMAKAHGLEYSKINAEMDISSAHDDVVLDLGALRDADDFNFAHDVFGIRGHLDRTDYPGKLTGCFVPRFTLKSKGLA